MNKSKNITKKVLSGVAMAAMAATPAVSFAATGTANLTDPDTKTVVLTESTNNGISTANTALGTKTTVSLASGADAAAFDTTIGNGTSVKGSAGTAVGAAATVDSFYGGTAVGSLANVAGGQMGTAVGYNAGTTGNLATAVGANSSAVANSVAIGAGSKATEANTVSVGTTSQTRKIVNVTAGVADTDAVNVSQLKSSLADKADKNLDNIDEDGKKVIKNLAGEAIGIKSTSGAITVNKTTDSKNGTATFDINLADNQTFKNLNVTENTVIGTDKSNTLTVNATTNLNGPVTVNNTATFNKGIDMNDTKITNVGDGKVEAGSKDAVNGGQLYDAVNGIRGGWKSDIDKAVGSVGAQAAAMSSLHPLEYDKDHKVSVSTSVGAYKSDVAGAVGAFYRPDNMSMISLQGAIGHNDNMYGLAYSQKFGHNKDADPVETVGDVKGAIADLKAENRELRDKYDEVIAMLMRKTQLPARVVSEVVVAPAPRGDGAALGAVQDKGEHKVATKIHRILGHYHAR